MNLQKHHRSGSKGDAPNKSIKPPTASQQTMKKSIKQRLLYHLEHEDGTLNDSDVDALYREAHHIPEDEETDLETVETWAVELARS